MQVLAWVVGLVVQACCREKKLHEDNAIFFSSCLFEPWVVVITLVIFHNMAKRFQKHLKEGECVSSLWLFILWLLVFYWSKHTTARKRWGILPVPYNGSIVEGRERGMKGMHTKN